MQDRIKIATVLSAIVDSLNISEFNKLQEVHRNGWKEYMNGSKSSQAQAERDKESVIAALVSELDETRISYITKLING